MSSLIRRNRNLFPSFTRFWDDDDFFVSNYSDTGTTVPSVNIKETDNSYEVEMAAPGIKKEDFKVELDNNVLTISSERTDEREEGGEKEKYSRREFSYQSFQEFQPSHGSS